MTPKEKAKELVDKMEHPLEGFYIIRVAAKQLALISVDELISQENSYNNGSFYPSKYWQEVKQEIEKL